MLVFIAHSLVEEARTDRCERDAGRGFRLGGEVVATCLFRRAGRGMGVDDFPRVLLAAASGVCPVCGLGGKGCDRFRSFLEGGTSRALA